MRLYAGWCCKAPALHTNQNVKAAARPAPRVCRRRAAMVRSATAHAHNHKHAALVLFRQIQQQATALASVSLIAFVEQSTAHTLTGSLRHAPPQARHLGHPPKPRARPQHSADPRNACSYVVWDVPLHIVGPCKSTAATHRTQPPDDSRKDPHQQQDMWPTNV